MLPRLAGRRLLGLLLRPASTKTGRATPDVHHRVEPLGVVGPFVTQRVAGQLIEGAGAQLLQAGLVILAPRTGGPDLDPIPQEAHDHLLGGVPSPVDIHRADECLGRVGEDRRLLPTPGLILALAEHQGVTYVELGGQLGQGRRVHDRSSHLGQLTFGHVGISAEHVVCDHQSENGVAEELEPLVGARPRVLRAP